MKAEVIAPYGFRCAPLGYKVEHFPLGSIMEGEPARWAVEAGAAVPVDEPRETKRRRRKASNAKQ